jgi:predicted Zn-dependent protease
MTTHNNPPRVYLPGLLLILLVLASTPGPVAAATYTHPTLGYRFTAPQGWIVDAPSKAFDARFRKPEVSCTLQLASTPMERLVDAWAFMAAWEKAMVGPDKVWRKRTTRTEKRVMGRPAAQGFYNIASGNSDVLGFSQSEPMKGSTAVITEQRRAYMISYFCPESAFKDNLHVLEKVIRSFQTPEHMAAEKKRAQKAAAPKPRKPAAPAPVKKAPPAPPKTEEPLPDFEFDEVEQ